MAFDRRYIFVVVLLAAAYQAWQRLGMGSKDERLGKAWYTVKLTSMVSGAESLRRKDKDLGARVADAAQHLARTFVPSEEDGETREFLHQCQAARNHITGWLTLLAKSAMVVWLQMLAGWSAYDAAAFVDFQTSFVASSAHFQTLLGSVGEGQPRRGLLDIGAGNGDVTAKLLEAMNSTPAGDVVAMETSDPLLRALSARGFRTAGDFSELGNSEQFGVVALLNVLDRCERPLDLLQAAMQRVQPGGVLLVATVVPYCPRVMRGRFMSMYASKEPEAPLLLHPRANCKAKPSNELGTAAFAAAAFADLPWRVRAWTRVPYVSSGDFKRARFIMSNSVFALERAE